jgi:hypothetical protein
MNESNYLSGEFTDEFLHEQADHLDNDSGNQNKKRRVLKLLSSSSSQTKYIQPGIRKTLPDLQRTYYL